VLVADDNVTYGALLGRFVSSQPDMEVVGLACDGSEAVRLALSLRPALVLMDLCMPGLDGFEATHALSMTGLDIKVVALTAHLAPDTERRCLESGADVFLPKSRVDTHLHRVIRELSDADEPPLEEPLGTPQGERPPPQVGCDPEEVVDENTVR